MFTRNRPWTWSQPTYPGRRGHPTGRELGPPSRKRPFVIRRPNRRGGPPARSADAVPNSRSSRGADLGQKASVLAHRRPPSDAGPAGRLLPAQKAGRNQHAQTCGPTGVLLPLGCFVHTKCFGGVDISKGIAQPWASRGEQDKAQIAGRGPFTARGNAAALLQPADGPFHDVALPVPHPVVVDRLLPVTPPRNHRFGPLHHDVKSQIIVIVAPVRQHVVRADRKPAGCPGHRPEHAAWCRSHPGFGPEPGPLGRLGHTGHQRRPGMPCPSSWTECGYGEDRGYDTAVGAQKIRARRVASHVAQRRHSPVVVAPCLMTYCRS